MKIGSLFSGIGGLELGLEWAGLGETIWQVEKDPYCRKILEKHWPNVRRYEDVREVGARNLEAVDLVCGGFPCQDVSAAGAGAGLGGTRSGLWYEFMRIVAEIRPEWVVVENVASGAKNWVDPVIRGLELENYTAFPVPLSAQLSGAWQLRSRIFIVAHAESERRRPERPDHRWTKGAENEPANSRESRTATKSDSAWKLQPQGLIEDEWERHGHCGWWAAEPPVGRVVHGLPHRLDRLRALGNAVVPQCAQVVGEFIKIMRGDNKL